MLVSSSPFFLSVLYRGPSLPRGSSHCWGSEIDSARGSRPRHSHSTALYSSRTNCGKRFAGFLIRIKYMHDFRFPTVTGKYMRGDNISSLVAGYLSPTPEHSPYAAQPSPPAPYTPRIRPIRQPTAHQMLPPKNARLSKWHRHPRHPSRHLQ